MKFKRLAIFRPLLFLAAFLGIFSAFSVQAEDAAQKDELAAKVNDAAITMKTLDTEFANSRQRMQMMGYPLDDSKLAQMKSQVLDTLIGMELIYQESQKEKISADAAAINAQIDKIKKQFPSEEEFVKGLAAQNLTEKELRNQMSKGIVIEKFIDQRIASKITIAEDDLKTFYTENPAGFEKESQVKARHILIKVEKNADEATKKKAKEEIDAILVEARKDGDFGELAKKRSQGPSSTRGGDLGFFSHKQMVKPFSDAAFALNPGEISDVVETQFGYHIIKCEEKKAASVVPFEEVKAKIKQFLREKTIRQKVMEMVEGLKGKANIERFIS